MYKVIRSILPANGNFSNITEVPGKLIGIAGENSGGAGNLYFQMMSNDNRVATWEFDGYDIFIDGAAVSLLNYQGRFYLVIQTDLPQGNYSYRVFNSNAQPADRFIDYLYEELPGVYNSTLT